MVHLASDCQLPYEVLRYIRREPAIRIVSASRESKLLCPPKPLASILTNWSGTSI